MQKLIDVKNVDIVKDIKVIKGNKKNETMAY